GHSGVPQATWATLQHHRVLVCGTSDMYDGSYVPVGRAEDHASFRAAVRSPESVDGGSAWCWEVVQAVVTIVAVVVFVVVVVVVV
ncbi:hypothetical protein PoB_004449100, partial [Plakobranchus ocellatus]